jgi:hypothetical protein
MIPEATMVMTAVSRSQPYLFAVAFGVPILKLRCLSSRNLLQVEEGLKPKNGPNGGRFLVLPHMLTELVSA